jgi:hypothetical protein
VAQGRRDRSKSKWSGAGQPEQDSQGNPATQQPDANRQGSAIATGGVYAPIEKDNKSDRIIARWTRVLGVFTALLVVVTAALAVLAYRADETSRASQRAFVGVKDVKITALGPEAGKNTPDFLYRIDTECENSGDTQTRNLTIDTNLTIPYMESMRLEWKPQNAHNLVILPKQITNCSFNTVIDAISLNSMKGNNSIGIMGAARYDDVYSKPHITLFCRILQPAPIDYMSGVATCLSVAQCPKYNCADDDCREYREEPGLSKALDYLK